FWRTPNGMFWKTMTGSIEFLLMGGKERMGIRGEAVILPINNKKRGVKTAVLFFFNTASGKYSWKRKELMRQQELLIGRDSRCDVVLDHVSVSKRHAGIIPAADGFYVVDHNSTNGTFVNGQRVLGRRKLKEKDILRIVDTRLIYANG